VSWERPGRALPVTLVWLALGANLPLLPARPIFVGLGMIPSLVWVLPVPFVIWEVARSKFSLRARWSFGVGLMLLASLNFEVSWNPPARYEGFEPSSVLFVNIHKDTRDVSDLVRLIQREMIQTVILQENRGGEASPAAFLKKSLGWNLVTDGVEGAILSMHRIHSVRTEKQTLRRTWASCWS
jgi:endonuclease/exonuclease/phosphatase (EEP) superfamily protein YafD